MSRVFTMRKCCPACRTWFTIGGSAAVYCQHKACQNKRRRQDYADRKSGKGAYASYTAEGSDKHLAQALKSGA